MRPENLLRENESPALAGLLLGAGATGLEPATSGVTGRRSNQLSYAPVSARVWQWKTERGPPLTGNHVPP